jgi:hypothetical protein
MKKFYLTLGYLAVTAIVYAQNVRITAQSAGISPSGLPINSGAGLDINYTNKGLLIPRVGLDSLTSYGPIVGTPTTSMLVYNTNNLLGQGYYYWDGSRWVRFVVQGGGTSDAWLRTGNVGTNPATNFIGTLDNQGLAFRTNNTERMRITDAGNVGIGTTAPNSPLTVVGNSLFGVNNPASVGAVQITTGGASPISNRLTYGTDGGGWKFAIGKNQGGTVTDQLTIQDNGYVGIGTVVPIAKLHVVDGSVFVNSSTTPIYAILGDGGVEVYRHPTTSIGPHVNGYIDFKDDPFDDYDARIYYSNPSGVGTGYNPFGAFVIETTTDGQPSTALPRVVVRNDNGNVGIGVVAPFYRLELPNLASPDGQGLANAWVTYSDARVKSQLKPIEGLSVVMKLNPLSYKHHDAEKTANGLLIKDSGTASFGFIAQELYKVLPEIVYKPLDDKNNLWSVDYDKLIPFLTKAIQEQQAIIEALKSEIDAIKSRLR